MRVSNGLGSMLWPALALTAYGSTLSGADSRRPQGEEVIVAGHDIVPFLDGEGPYTGHGPSLSLRLPLAHALGDTSSYSHPSLEDETYTIRVHPASSPYGYDPSLSFDGIRLPPSISHRKDTETVNGSFILGHDYFKEANLLASWEVALTCLKFNLTLCKHEDLTKTIVLKIQDVADNILSGFTMTYSALNAEILVFNRYYDLAAILDRANSKHWKSLDVASSSAKADVEPQYISSVISSSMSTISSTATFMHSAPTFTTEPHAEPLSSPAHTTTIHQPHHTYHESPPPSPSDQKTLSASSLYTTVRHLIDLAKKIKPCPTSLLRQSQSFLAAPSHFDRVSILSDETTPMPTSTVSSVQSTIYSSNPYYRAFEITTIIFIVVCISCFVFGRYIASPRRRVDMAARREERRNRRLYRCAAARQRWASLFERIGERIKERLQERGFLKTQVGAVLSEKEEEDVERTDRRINRRRQRRDRSSSATLQGSYDIDIEDADIEVDSNTPFDDDEKSYGFSTRATSPRALRMTSDLRREFNALRSAHVFVDDVLAHASTAPPSTSRGGYYTGSSRRWQKQGWDAPDLLFKNYIRSTRRTWGRLYGRNNNSRRRDSIGSTGSTSSKDAVGSDSDSTLPPYEFEGASLPLGAEMRMGRNTISGLVGTGTRVLGGGRRSGLPGAPPPSDDGSDITTTPDSSVVGTSPVISLDSDEDER
ncbi:hypothetical protein MMC25_002878 [Agyrium rufum]|nr:hypothetical protein [Agyrium rufum]